MDDNPVASSTAPDAALRDRFNKIPMFTTLPFRIVSARNGEAELALGYKREFDGVFESLHGGLLMTLADTVACMAVLTLAGQDAMVTTTDMNIRFLSACRTDAHAHAKIIKFGRTMVPVEVNIFDEQGTHVAVAQVNYMRLSSK